MKTFARAALAALVACLLFNAATAGELLRVDGSILKWQAPAPEAPVVVTYALLTGNFAVPGDRAVVSRDNCGAMHAFAGITVNSPGVAEEAVRHELRAAFAAWEAVAALTFVEVADARRANIVIGAADVPRGRAFANLSYRRGPDPATLAGAALGPPGRPVAAAPRPSAGVGPAVAIEQAYVCLNPQMRWKIGFDGNVDVYDLRYTFTHEIGHAIGLDHSGRTGSVMSYKYGERVHRLQPSDIAAVQRLYGAPATGTPASRP